MTTTSGKSKSTAIPGGFVNAQLQLRLGEHAGIFAGFQYDWNRDAFPVTAVRMNRTERDLVQSYQPPKGRSLLGTLAKNGCETPAACAAAFTAASFGPCATSRLPSSATHSPAK